MTDMVEPGAADPGRPESGVPEWGVPDGLESRGPEPGPLDPGDLDSAPRSLPVPLRAALEAVLIVASDPMLEAELAEVVGAPEESVAEQLRALAEEYMAAGRGFELRRAGGGWRFYSAAACAGVVRRWVTDGKQARLSQAALETLAVIAYKQPVSRAKVGSIRGVNVDAVVRTLQARGLITPTDEDPLTGAALYRTTGLFLDRMGISELSELPPIVDLLPDPEDVAELVDGETIVLP